MLTEGRDMKKLLYVVVFSIVQSVYSDPSYDPIKKYGVEPAVKALLDEHQEELLTAFDSCQPDVCVRKHRVYEFPWLPGYLVKTHISRIFGAQRARTCIKENNLDLLIVPDKWVYTLAGKTFIIVRKLNTIKWRPLNLRQVQQLWTFVLKTDYTDLHAGNYIFLENDRIALIDTETRSYGLRTFKALSRFIINHYPFHYEEDAFKYVLQELARLVPKDITHIPHTMIAKKGKYSYPKLYRKMYTNLTHDEHVFEWDYIAFFKENFPDPSEG